jgi:hypothetical protein
LTALTAFAGFNTSTLVATAALPFLGVSTFATGFVTFAAGFAGVFATGFTGFAAAFAFTAGFAGAFTAGFTALTGAFAGLVGSFAFATGFAGAFAFAAGFTGAFAFATGLAGAFFATGLATLAGAFAFAAGFTGAFAFATGLAGAFAFDAGLAGLAAGFFLVLGIYSHLLTLLMIVLDCLGAATLSTCPKFLQNKAQVAELNRFFSGNRGL